MDYLNRVSHQNLVANSKVSGPHTSLQSLVIAAASRPPAVVIPSLLALSSSTLQDRSVILVCEQNVIRIIQHI